MGTEERPHRRPKDPEPRPHRMEVRLSEAEYAALTSAAAAAGMARGAWLAGRALASAEAAAEAMSGHDVDRLHELGEQVADARARYDAEVALLIPERDELCRKLYRDGLSLREIAAVADLSHVRVREIVQAR